MESIALNWKKLCVLQDSVSLCDTLIYEHHAHFVYQLSGQNTNNGHKGSRIPICFAKKVFSDE